MNNVVVLIFHWHLWIFYFSGVLEKKKKKLVKKVEKKKKKRKNDIIIALTY